MGTVAWHEGAAAPEIAPSRSLWERGRKKAAMALILGSVAIGVPHVVENWDTLWSRGVLYGATYAGFVALYSAGGIAKGVNVVRRKLGSRHGAEETRGEAVRPDNLPLSSPIQDSLQVGADEESLKRQENKFLLANGVGAVGMGVTALAATVALLPRESWPVPMVAATVDVIGSVWSRMELRHSMTPESS